MSDLSHLLGDVYGERDPDSPPVAGEPSADERGMGSSARKPGAPDIDDLLRFSAPARPGAAPGPALDDDLAAALSAALGDVAKPVPAATAADFDDMPPPPAPKPAPVAPARQQAAAPASSPAAAVRVPTPQPPAGSSAWSAAPHRATVEASAGNPMPAQHRLWQPGDDDIFPSATAKRAKR
ncbi:MAG: hypothetical protein AVDCRST_MAG50-2744 [uncultured Acidimicrobiales bacterium]|uniref:Uncharacterized protein n=1 Tax=uncultured Acidimicrobiales bacterium TaxID=310071 RepID=A0A6J4IPQ3_9ACTN|nr:MAG: hypothetical protein AVDCRST_MAG50-2744 [uncultured Acidimicrobiales bacterium]